MFDDGSVTRLRSAEELDEARDLLARFDLRLDGDVTASFGLRHEGRLVGTASVGGAVIKCLAVDEAHLGEGLSARLVTRCLDHLADEGMHHSFVFTRPASADRLVGLGFSEVAATEDAVLLEGGSGSVARWSASLAHHRLPGDRAAAVVVNGNPLTRGHLHLLERALEAEGALHVLVVSTDRSLFPTEVRIRLIREAFAHSERVRVHETGPYVVSMATFPSYFTREEDLARVQARLDVAVFLRWVVPALSITARWVGEEPYCPVTRLYNQAMAEILPPAGCALEVLPRKASAGEAISASRVRQILRDGGTADDVAELVPEATLRFLRSAEARPILETIRSSRSRH